MGNDQHIDCLVVGGGPAGLAAAVTAARRGAAVSLVERWDRLGGTPVAGFQQQLCGYYANDPDHPFKILNGGFAEAFVQRLDGRNPQCGQRVGRVEVHPFKPAACAAACQNMAVEQKRLDVYLSTAFAGARMTGRRITAVDLVSSGQTRTVCPRTVIDCSGGAVIKAAGAGRPDPPVVRRPDAGFSVYVSGLKDENDSFLPVKVPYAIRLRVDGDPDVVPRWVVFTTFSPALTAKEGVLRLNIPAAEEAVRAPAVAERLLEWLREDIPAFEQAVIKQMSPGVLPRDGYCLKGQTLLTEQDVLSAKQPDDVCVRGAWPIEFWGAGAKPDYGYLAPGASYGIARGCLRAMDVDNVFAAGRCLSAEPRALASCRVAGISLSTGEAAAEEAVKSLNNG